MKITKKKPLRPRGRSDGKRQSTKDAIRDAYANGPQREVQIIPAKKDLTVDKEQRKFRVSAYRISDAPTYSYAGASPLMSLWSAYASRSERIREDFLGYPRRPSGSKLS